MICGVWGVLAEDSGKRIGYIVLGDIGNAYIELLAASILDKAAKHIGQRLAIQSVLIGLLIAYLIMMYFKWEKSEPLNSILWIKDDNYAFNMLVGAFGLLISGYFLGQRAGIEILIRKRNPKLVGVITGLAILWTGTILGSTIGFIQEGIEDFGSYDNPFVDYYVKPIFWVTFFGLLPVIAVGIWFGGRIKRTTLQK